MDFSSPDTWRWIWLVVAVGATLGEISVAGSFALAPFAVAAFAAAVVSFAGLPVVAGWLVFVVTSVVLSAALRPLARRLDASTPRTAIGSNRWAGREAVVLREIPAGTGETGLIRLDREEWRAESLTGDRIAAGSTVLVSRVDGTRLVVVPISEPKELS